MYLCLCTFCINYYITLNEVILVCFVYFSILHVYSIITIIITLVIYSQIAVMWTTNTEPKGSDLPEPNHCALLVPRQWSTGLRIYNPCPKASVVDPVPEPSDPSTPAPDPSDVDSIQPADVDPVPAAGRRKRRRNVVAQPFVDPVPEPSDPSTPAQPADVDPEDCASYRIITSGTKRQKPMLIDPKSYKYQVDKRR